MERVQRTSHSGTGPTLQSEMEAHLFDACWRYLEMKSIGWAESDLEVRLQRGVIRGVAMGLMLYVRMYKRPRIRITSKKDQIDYVKRLEKRWINRAKAVRSTGVFDILPASRIADDGITAKW